MEQTLTQNAKLLEQIMQHPDGTWFLTDKEVAQIFATVHHSMSHPQPTRIDDGTQYPPLGLWWRRKQLLQHLATAGSNR